MRFEQVPSLRYRSILCFLRDVAAQFRYFAMGKKSTAILIAKLMEIDTACSPERAKLAQQEAEKNLDQFSIDKKKLAAFIREIRKDLKDRDAAQMKGDRKTAAEKSAIVRRKLKEADEKGKSLEKIQKTKSKKLKIKKNTPGVKVSDEKIERDDTRKKVVEVMWKHLEDLDRQERRANASVMESESGYSSSGERDVVIGGIPDIDDPGFALLRKQDAEIDQKLDIAHEGIIRLKKLALEAGQEIDEQQDLIENLNEIAEETLGKLATVNDQLKKTLKEVRSGRDFCCDCILFGLVLGIAVAIYFVITG